MYAHEHGSLMSEAHALQCQSTVHFRSVLPASFSHLARRNFVLKQAIQQSYIARNRRFGRTWGKLNVTGNSSKMSSAGPELPPHLLAKRKRQAEEEVAASNKEPTKPPTQDSSRSISPETSEKRRKIAGPAPPPAPLNQRPAGPPIDEASDSDSDDDFGPAMPSATGPQTSMFDNISADDKSRSIEAGGSQRLQRDDWMMAPPSHDDALSRIDPTKMRARKFNTGRAGGAPADHREMGAAWFETPEEKRKRLENEMMGVSSKTASAQPSASGSNSKSRDEETARRVKEHNEKNRGKSLYDSHQTSSGKVEEDDPSKRAFDREKDVGGVKIRNAQRKELLQKASNGFSSKFSGGGYL